MDERRKVKFAENEARFRAVNELQTARLDEFHDGAARSFDVMCECANPECEETLTLSVDDYAHVRTCDVWFVVATGHDDPRIERVVEARDGWSIIEKIGVGADVAAER